MSEQTKQTDNTVNNQQHKEVDNADPESPTLAIRRLASPTTGPNERLTDVVETNDKADTADTVLPGGVTTLASPADEAPTISQSSTPSKRDSELPNHDEVMVYYSLSHPPMKRRRLDLETLWLKQRVRLSLSQTNRSKTFGLSDDQR